MRLPAAMLTSAPVSRPPPWAWVLAPLRWLLVGCWGLRLVPISSTAYGLVFYVNGWVWHGVLKGTAPGGLGFATFLTGATLVLLPALTATLLAARAPQAPHRQPDEPGARLNGLFALGILLVLILAAALEVLCFAFALLFTGPVPSMPKMAGVILSWQNLPLAVTGTMVVIVAVLLMQALVAVPSCFLCRPGGDLWDAFGGGTAAIRKHWRPLICWGLASQLLLFGLGGLAPLSLVFLAPAVALGTGWAQRELMPNSRRVGTSRSTASM